MFIEKYFLRKNFSLQENRREKTKSQNIYSKVRFTKKQILYIRKLLFTKKIPKENRRNKQNRQNHRIFIEKYVLQKNKYFIQENFSLQRKYQKRTREINQHRQNHRIFIEKYFKKEKKNVLQRKYQKRKEETLTAIAGDTIIPNFQTSRSFQKHITLRRHWELSREKSNIDQISCNWMQFSGERSRSHDCEI